MTPRATSRQRRPDRRYRRLIPAAVAAATIAAGIPVAVAAPAHADAAPPRVKIEPPTKRKAVEPRTTRTEHRDDT